MTKIGYLSFFAAALNGIASSKRSLVLFDKVIIPSTESGVERQIEVFSGKYGFVKNYLKDRLIPLVRLDKDYSAAIDEMVDYFGKYHFNNWLSPVYEEVFGDPGSPTGAEVNWEANLRLWSVLLSRTVTADKRVPTYGDDLELLKLNDFKGVEGSPIISAKTTVNDIYDGVIPDPAYLEWDELVDILEDPAFPRFREKLWSSVQEGVRLSDEYMRSLEEFFSTNFPSDLLGEISINISEGVVGLVFSPLGVLKSLYSIATAVGAHKEFSWLTVVFKMKKGSG